MPSYLKSDQLHKKEKAVIASEAKPIKKRKPLKLMSKRAKQELKVWTKVKNERIGLLAEKFGYVPCELCDEVIKNNVFLKAEGHHNDHDRRNNTLENCRILHRACNQAAEDRNIKDVPSLL